MTGNQVRLYLPRDTTALAAGADDVAAALTRAASRSRKSVFITRTGTRGIQRLEPLLEIEIEGSRHGFGPLRVEHVAPLVKLGLFTGRIDKLQSHSLHLGPVENLLELKRETHPALRLCGLIDPLSLDAYRRHGGLQGLGWALTLTPSEILETLQASHGADNTARLRRTAPLRRADDETAIVCEAHNGVGDLASQILIEGNPFALIEGMAVVGLAVGASHGVVRLGPGQKRTAEILATAIELARAAKVLGPSLMGSGAAFDIEIDGDNSKRRSGQKRAKRGADHKKVASRDGVTRVIERAPSFAAVPLALTDQVRPVPLEFCG